MKIEKVKNYIFMKKLIFLTALLAVICCEAVAQRHTDRLGRGLVVVPTGSTDGSTSNLVSWRRLAGEYYDTKYNLYRDGNIIARNLTKTSYDDTSNGLPSSSYEVAPVVRGVEGDACDPVTAWMQYVYKYNVRCPTGFLDIELAEVRDRDNRLVTTDYEPNDAEMADLDGDGELEIIVKRLNTADAGGYDTGRTDSSGKPIWHIYPATSRAFVIFDAYKVNWQTGAATLLWRIDCGPNMVSLNSTEVNLIAYDWDEDGKAEVVVRGADDMIIHASDGTKQTIGVAGYNFRSSPHFSHESGGQYAWTHFGREYLVYINGQTGKTYQVTDFPLPRLERSEWASLTVSVPYNDYVALANAGYGNYFTKNTGVLTKAWGDNYGHRSSKYFMGAPCLDGRRAYLFLARGIYTRHKMIAMKLGQNHQWEEQWTWSCNNSNSPWYGNGYHNFVVADVDEDGRDEIVYGSMVIDDNGKGLSTTGYEHGDAQHVGDFDPWRKGLEFFGCLEDGPYYGCNYRDATTSEVLYKFTATGDDGRALMGNFSNDYPGSQGRSWDSPTISSITAQALGDVTIQQADLNARIYWDGDLCSEILDSPGTAKEASVEKIGPGRLFTSSGCNMNNDSKNNPCFQGDIIGDWREEIVVRCGHNLRVYTSGMSTSYSMPSLWFDHQYRQAMVWQMMAYNQPPHLSYFLGEMESYTTAPPPLTDEGRVELALGATIGTNMNGQHVMACKAADMTINVEEGAAPWVFTDNAPSWVKGNDINGTTGTKVRTNGSVGATNLPAISREYYTHTVTGAPFSGTMHLSKQGDGKLILPDGVHTYSGATTVWGGILECNGKLSNSAVALKRFTTLNTSGGEFPKGITMEYDATINIGGSEAGNIGTMTTGTLTMNYGSRLVIDVNGSGDDEHDLLNATTLVLETAKATKDVWKNYGPENIVPVIEINSSRPLASGRYVIGNVNTVRGDLAKVMIEGSMINYGNVQLVFENRVLYVELEGLPMVQPATIAVAGMSPVDYEGRDDCYLPVVSVEASETDGQQPQLSATFTALDGTVETFEQQGAQEIFSQDYESVSSLTGWTKGASDCAITLGTGDPVYGQYFYLNTADKTRYAYKKVNVDVSDSPTYTIEFDLALKTSTKEPIEFCVMSKNGTMPSNYWDNYASINNNANMLFDLYGESYSTSYKVNGTSTTVTLGAETWYHYTLVVDQAARTVAWTISNGSSGTFALPEGTSTVFGGIYIVAARYNPVFKFDNLRITGAAKDFSTFAFTKPGTLTVTSSIGDGTQWMPSTTSFTVEEPYVKTYETADYSTVAAADASGVLGNMWRPVTTTTLWSDWNTNHYVYGRQYVMVEYLDNNNTSRMFLDNDRVVWADYGGSQYPLQLVQDFGIGQNMNSVFHAEHLGDERTWVMVRSDLSQGYNVSTTEMVHPDGDGLFSYQLATNGTLQQVAVYKPLSIADAYQGLPTAINTVVVPLPQGVYNLNGQLVRRNAGDLQGLMPGIYVVGGRKVVKK